MSTGAEQPGPGLGKTPAPGHRAEESFLLGRGRCGPHSSGEECPAHGLMGSAPVESLGTPGRGAGEGQPPKPTPLLCFFTGTAPKGHGLAAP